MPMIRINAPEGYEAIRQYRDSAKEWEVAIRRVGETYWTILGYIGHTRFTEAELDSRAEARIACPRLGIAAHPNLKLSGSSGWVSS